MLSSGPGRVENPLLPAQPPFQELRDLHSLLAQRAFPNDRDAPTRPEETRERSRSVALRFARSCSGWRRRPTAEEFHEAVRAEAPTARQRAILDTWATEAEWEELLAAWTEHAYTFRELATALHRAGLSRCRAAATLNRWAIYPGQLGIDD